ncbi:MAG: HD domain-containing protein [Ruminiclostridium sp.]|nr:HD domain-containing protein [Ruminiclostridium sp.]
MPENRILSLLEAGDWGEDTPLIQGLKGWTFYPLLLEAYRTMDEDALYKSKVHGSGHIHRVLLFAALIAWREDLAEADIRQLFRAASYHDVGRTFDGFDLYHGVRSSLKLEELTDRTGEDLVELKAAVTAHAHPDADMESILRSFRPEDYPRTLELTRLLKDADNLDRVRLKDLDARFIRHDSAKELVPFAWRLLDLDQAWKKAHTT